MTELTQQETDSLVKFAESSYGRRIDGVGPFVESVIPKIVSHLAENRETAKGMTDVTKTVKDVLDADNVRDIEVRAEPLENPRVTVWLRDCPVWANTATQVHHYPFGINAYNGKVETIIDVRQF